VNVSGTSLLYQITIQNTGNIDLTNLQIIDPLLNNGVTCAPVAVGATLPANGTTVCAGVYTVTQANINAGTPIVNNVTVVTTQFGPVVASATTTVVRTPALSVSKSALVNSVSAAGQAINYIVAIRNTGNTDLTNLQVVDPLIDTRNNNLVCTPFAKGATLPFGQSTSCQGSYTVTQSDINSGSPIINIVNVATTQTPAQQAQVTTNVLQNAQFTVTKAANVAFVTAANQPIVYSIVVTNTGNVDLSPFQITDSRLAAGVICNPVPAGSTLTVGNRTVCTGTYTTTQADINAGQPLTNVVSVSFSQVPQAQTATANVNVQANPALSVTKTGDRSTVTAAGQTVTYTMLITNTGNQDLENLQVADSLLNAGSLVCSPVAIGQTLSVAIGSTTCTARYTVTQTDINSGAPLLNTVIVQSRRTLPQSASFTVSVLQQPAFTISKTVDQSVALFAGQRLRYTIQVRNTGNQDLTVFNLQDPLITTGGGQNDLSCAPVSFGQTLTVSQPLTTCTGSLVVTQAQLNAGVAITNTATAQFQQAQPQSASVSTTITQTPALTITKTANVATVSSAGQVIGYSIVVTNGGNVDLTSLSVSDNKVQSLTCANFPIGGTLPVNASTVCQGSYIVTQADIDAGQPIVNRATASSRQTQPVSAIANVNVQQNSMFNVTKSASLLSVNRAGQVIQYAIQIVNTGNTDLLSLTVADPLVTQSGNNDLRCSPVAVGQTLTTASPRTICSGTYTVSQQDINAGNTITNVATVSFTQTGAQSAVANTIVVREPSFTVVKTASAGSVNVAGQRITYTIVVSNTGNTDLSNMQVSDLLIDTGNRDLTCTPVAVGQKLLVSSSTTCTGSYTVTQSNINSGAPIVNTVRVTFTEAPQQSAVATTTISQSPAFTISKAASVATVNAANQRIDYSVTITNVGNVDLLNLQLSDPLIDGQNLNSVQCSPVAKGGTLSVAARSTICTGSYFTMQADINAGVPIVNFATAQFTNAPPASAQVSVAVQQRPLFTLTKTADRQTVRAAGDVIRYTLTLQNTGNVDLPGLQIQDPLIDSFANNLQCTPIGRSQTLLVGATTTCSGSYTATQENINAGTAILNVANAQAGNAPPTTASVFCECGSGRRRSSSARGPTCRLSTLLATPSRGPFR
jgi:uncharacterized repeat protein (TIGR01451 family)